MQTSGIGTTSPHSPPNFVGALAETSDFDILQRAVAEIHASLGLDAALAMIEHEIEAGPGDGNIRMLLGVTLLRSGRHADAFRALSDARALGTDREILDLLAKAIFPGPRFRDHLDALHALLQPKVYLEIGVFEGQTLALARAHTHVIGIDPAPRPRAARDYAAPTRIHKVASDAYFAAVAAGNAPPETFDLAFIDGLHIFEQVLRDFMNVERYCRPGSVIVLHDTLPVTAESALRMRRTNHWCGDVWKILPCLRRFRPELSILTIPTHPSGLTLITGLDPASRTLPRRFAEAVGSFIDAPIPMASLAPCWFGDIENDIDAVADWLAEHRPGL
jgi:SAM-dependent methyltransferase